MDICQNSTAVYTHIFDGWCINIYFQSQQSYKDARQWSCTAAVIMLAWVHGQSEDFRNIESKFQALSCMNSKVSLQRSAEIQAKVLPPSEHTYVFSANMTLFNSHIVAVSGAQALVIGTF